MRATRPPISGSPRPPRTRLIPSSPACDRLARSLRSDRTLTQALIEADGRALLAEASSRTRAPSSSASPRSWATCAWNASACAASCPRSSRQRTTRSSAARCSIGSSPSSTASTAGSSHELASERHGSQSAPSTSATNAPPRMHARGAGARAGGDRDRECRGAGVGCAARRAADRPPGSRRMRTSDPGSSAGGRRGAGACATRRDRRRRARRAGPAGPRSPASRPRRGRFPVQARARGRHSGCARDRSAGRVAVRTRLQLRLAAEAREADLQAEVEALQLAVASSTQSGAAAPSERRAAPARTSSTAAEREKRRAARRGCSTASTRCERVSATSSASARSPTRRRAGRRAPSARWPHRPPCHAGRAPAAGRCVGRVSAPARARACASAPAADLSHGPAGFDGAVPRVPPSAAEPARRGRDRRRVAAQRPRAAGGVRAGALHHHAAGQGLAARRAVRGGLHEATSACASTRARCAIRNLRADLYTFSGRRMGVSDARRAVRGVGDADACASGATSGRMQVGGFTLVLTGEPNASRSCGPKQTTRVVKFRGCRDDAADRRSPARRGGDAADYESYLSVPVRSTGPLIRDLTQLGLRLRRLAARPARRACRRCSARRRSTTRCCGRLTPGSYTVIVEGLLDEQPRSCGRKRAAGHDDVPLAVRLGRPSWRPCSARSRALPARSARGAAPARRRGAARLRRRRCRSASARRRRTPPRSQRIGFVRLSTRAGVRVRNVHASSCAATDARSPTVRAAGRVHRRARRCASRSGGTLRAGATASSSPGRQRRLRGDAQVRRDAAARRAQPAGRGSIETERDLLRRPSGGDRSASPRAGRSPTCARACSTPTAGRSPR